MCKHITLHHIIHKKLVNLFFFSFPRRTHSIKRNGSRPYFFCDVTSADFRCSHPLVRFKKKKRNEKNTLPRAIGVYYSIRIVSIVLAKTFTIDINYYDYCVFLPLPTSYSTGARSHLGFGTFRRCRDGKRIKNIHRKRVLYTKRFLFSHFRRRPLLRCYYCYYPLSLVNVITSFGHILL